MKKPTTTLFIVLIFISAQLISSSQPVVNFTLPDSTCVGSQINITNLTTGGTTFYWNFCSGNANNDPSGVNVGNPGYLLNVPTYITLVQDGNNYYSFVSCQLAGIIRNNHGSSLSQNPVSWTNLGTFGILGNHIEGIQIKYDEGSWYGFVCNDNSLVRLNFGNSLSNNPTGFNLGTFSSMDFGHGLQIIKEGNTWIGFASCSIGNNLVRFNFGNSLSNIPTCENLGNLANFNVPTQLVVLQENNLWYILLLSGGNNSLCRLSFGASLLNFPTGVNLGNVGGLENNGGLTVINDCNSLSGYFTKYLTDGLLGKLTFDGGITGTVTGQVLGNIGNLNKPHSFSEIFRQNDTLFSYITNRGTNTLTRLIFPPCTNATVPSSNQFTPPPFSYNLPGTYNVRLIVNEGQSDQVSICKTIVISPPPAVDLGPDRISCLGVPVNLDAGPGFSSYLWSTGQTTRTIFASTAGTYSVTVGKSGCTASDSVHILMETIEPVDLGPDTTVCQGQAVTFDAGSYPTCSYLWLNLGSGVIVGSSQTFTTGQAGSYEVIVTDPIGCQTIDSVQLITVTSIVITNYPLYKSICSGSSTNIILTANVPGTEFSWTASGSSAFVSGFSPGNGDTINQVLTNTNTIDETVSYTLKAFFGNCTGDSVGYTVTVHPLKRVEVTINASLNPVCPGTPVTFITNSVNQGQVPSYHWKVNHTLTGPDAPVFTYIPSEYDTIMCILNSSMECPSDNPAASNLIVVSYYPFFPVNLGADTSICPGNTITFDAGSCLNCSYLWSNLYTGQQNIGSGQTYTTRDIGIYCVSLTDSNGCETKDTIQLSYKTALPVIAGNNKLCLDTTLHSYHTQPGMHDYQWNISSGGTIVSGLLTDSINVKWNNSGNQAVGVNYQTPSGCSATNPANFQVFVYSLPELAGPIKGPQQICTGYSDQTFSIDSIPFAQSYVWSLPAGVQFISGQGTNTITVSFDPTVNSGDINVYAMNACGNGTSSPPFHITMLHTPSVEAGPDQTIPYNSATILNGQINDGSGSYFYSWTPVQLFVDDTSLNPRTLKLSNDSLFFLTVTDKVTGCQNFDSVRVHMTHHEVPEDCLVFYNVITPNGDDVNDKWIIDCIENFPENDVIIFNIWGDNVYQVVNYNNESKAWKGTRENGKPLPDGTYYYVLSIKDGGTHRGWIFIRGNIL